MDSLLEISGVTKSYAGPVLSAVDFEVRAGEVHALVGENGAGKSTLARIIAGLTRPDAGSMRLRGQPYAPRSKLDAKHHGIRIVLQELNVIGTLTIAENIFLEQWPHHLGWIRFPHLNAEAKRIMDLVGLNELKPDRLVGTLRVAQQQLVEIAAGLSRQCRLLILDEPTASLAEPEIERLFAQIHRLKSAGVGFVYISHRLEEIQRIANRVTVLRDGKVVRTRPAQEWSRDEMVRLMVGRPLGESTRPAAADPDKIALRVSHLRRPPAVVDVSFEVRQGEILGFAGLMGCGRTETMRAIFGADRRESGDIFLRGSPQPAQIQSPRDAVRQGIAFVTEDRKEQGLFLPLPVRVNTTLPALVKLASRTGWIRFSAELEAAEQWRNKLAVRCASLEQAVVELSGGNQQKVVLAKWLLRNCDVLLVDEPTRGIDVGAKFEIYQLLADLAKVGKAVLMVSSDLAELLALCDRIAVLSAGRIAAVFNRDEWTQDKIMAAALSGYAKEEINRA